MASDTSSGADGADLVPLCATFMPGVGSRLFMPTVLNCVTFSPASIV